MSLPSGIARIGNIASFRGSLLDSDSTDSDGSERSSRLHSPVVQFESSAVFCGGIGVGAIAWAASGGIRRRFLKFTLYRFDIRAQSLEQIGQAASAFQVVAQQREHVLLVERDIVLYQRFQVVDETLLAVDQSQSPVSGRVQFSNQPGNHFGYFARLLFDCGILPIQHQKQAAEHQVGKKHDDQERCPVHVGTFSFHLNRLQKSPSIRSESTTKPIRLSKPAVPFATFDSQSWQQCRSVDRDRSAAHHSVFGAGFVIGLSSACVGHGPVIFVRQLARRSNTE